MARNGNISRIQRLRDYARNAEIMGETALRMDQRLANARRDLISLAAAANVLADKLTAEADDLAKPHS